MPKVTAPPGKLTLAQATQVAGVSAHTLRRAARRGQVPGAYRIGHCWRFDEQRLRSFVEAGGNASPAATHAPALSAA